MTRAEILIRFEAWLDEALASEAAPQGVDAELLAAMEGGANPPEINPQGYDSYSLWSATTALTQEVKLQSRSFKDLAEAVSSQSAAPADEMRVELAREADLKARRDILGGLIDLRDSLERGVEAARQAVMPPLTAPPDNRTWLQKLVGTEAPRAIEAGGSEAVKAMIKGYELTLERLDHLLGGFDARQIPCMGLAFDPRCMNAVDIEESDEDDDGRVKAVYRGGYEWNGDVFRTAQVRVARAARSVLE